MAEAARQLGLTHGAIAQQIRALEKELGVGLVERAGRTIHLTEKANVLLQPVALALEQVDGIRRLAKSDQLAGELRLGAGNSALISVVPTILEQLVKEQPLLNVYIHPGHSQEFYPKIEQQQLDAAIAMEAPYELPKSLGWQLLREEPFVLAVHKRHAEKNPHQLLRSQPYIRFERGNWGARSPDNYLRRVGITPNDRFELNAIEAIGVMVSKDLGVALLPRSTNKFLARLDIVGIPLPEPCEPRRFGLIWSRASPRLSLIKAFTKTAIREYGRFDEAQ